jgi:hypothetical protein
MGVYVIFRDVHTLAVVREAPQGALRKRARPAGIPSIRRAGATTLIGQVIRSRTESDTNVRLIEHAATAVILFISNFVFFG